jgi:hypothetical protein
MNLHGMLIENNQVPAFLYPVAAGHDPPAWWLVEVGMDNNEHTATSLPGRPRDGGPPRRGSRGRAGVLSRLVHDGGCREAT